MKKIFVFVSVVLVAFVFYACKGTPKAGVAAVDPGHGPQITLQISEDPFSPDPDNPDDLFEIPITLVHRDPAGTDVDIQDWNIEIRTVRQAQSIREQEIARQQAEAAGEEVRPARVRRAFYEESGEGAPPAVWRWNGRNTDGSRTMTSATDYQFTLTVNDVFGNTTVTEGVIVAGIMVIRDGDVLKIDVDSIIFQADQANFLNVVGNVTEEAARNNRRVMRLIGNALNRFDGYRITVEGHANAVSAPGTNPTQDNNLRILSERRAQAIVDYLANADNVDPPIARSRLTAVGRGTTQMLAPFDDPEENFRNRRVEFILER